MPYGEYLKTIRGIVLAFSRWVLARCELAPELFNVENLPIAQEFMPFVRKRHCIPPLAESEVNMRIKERDSASHRVPKCARCWSTITFASFTLFTLLATLQAQKDPGPRAGAASAGGAYPTLNAQEVAFFKQTLARFNEVDSVTGSLAGETGSGLGPTFNGNSCAGCHSQPAVGGSSPSKSSHQNPAPNPQIAMAALDGATNTVPSFITADGRCAR